MKGKFVTFEGCEGSGKSTQLRLLGEKLAAAGVDFIITREPGGSDVAEQIRRVILDGKNSAMCDECEALLYAAARAQHVREIILPALAAGKLVLCDRYVYSSLAYQGAARGLGEEFIRKINSFALNDCPPDLTVFLNIPPDRAFERKHGADENDRIERLGLEFHRKVYGGYLSLLQNNPDICAVECSGTKFETNQKIYDLLKQKGII